MKQEFFWPIYQQIEKDFKELSLYVLIDKKQLGTYSIKIADLILRTVSECENISKALCKRNSVKFLDKKRRVRKFVNFHEYIDKLDSIYGIHKKFVKFIYANADEKFIDSGGLTPFKKEEINLGKKKKTTWSWYHAYNLIKHDRVKNYRKANLGNLIDAMAALFLLNIYYKDEKFYDEESYDVEAIVKKIESFSVVFKVDYTIKMDIPKDANIDNNLIGISINNFVSYMELMTRFSTYTIEYNKRTKTPSDEVADLMEVMESSKGYLQPDGSIIQKYESYDFTDHKSRVKLFGYIHKKDHS